MTPDEYQNVRNWSPPLTNPKIHWLGEDCTLIYGYDCDRNTWHIYSKDGQIHKLVYYPSNLFFDRTPNVLSHLTGEKLPCAELVPNKRAYPARTNYSFACQLRMLGFPLTFTTYDPVKLKGTYYGLTVEDFL